MNDEFNGDTSNIPLRRQRSLDITTTVTSILDPSNPPAQEKRRGRRRKKNGPSAPEGYFSSRVMSSFHDEIVDLPANSDHDTTSTGAEPRRSSLDALSSFQKYIDGKIFNRRASNESVSTQTSQTFGEELKDFHSSNNNESEERKDFHSTSSNDESRRRSLDPLSSFQEVISSKIFNRRASNESMASKATQGSHGEDLKHQPDEQQKMDEFKMMITEIRATNPNLSMMQAQHLAVTKINEEKRNQQEKSIKKPGRRTRRSLVAMKPTDNNRNNLIRGISGRNLVPESSLTNTFGGGSLGLVSEAAAAVNRTMTGSTNSTSMQKEENDKRPSSDEGQSCLLRRDSCRDPDMLQSILTLQQHLENGDFDDKSDVSDDRSGKTGPRRRRISSSARSDLSIRSERSLEAERRNRDKLTRNIDGKAKMIKRSSITSTAKKLFRRKESVDETEENKNRDDKRKTLATGRRTSIRRRSSQAPSLPDIQEAEWLNPDHWDAQIQDAENNALSGSSGKMTRRKSCSFASSVSSDSSIDVPAGELICRW